METTITFATLAPVIAAVVGPMLLFAAATMRYQHLDSSKTRDLIDRNRELIDRNRERSEQAHKETRDLLDRNYRELSGSLGDARERLSRMEGYLRAQPPPSQPAGDTDVEAA